MPVGFTISTTLTACARGGTFNRVHIDREGMSDLMGSALSDDNVKNYLVRIYFGSVESDPVRSVINRAYRDFNRTLRGFGAFPDRNGIKTAAAMQLRNSLHALGGLTMHDQAEFDEWHEQLCMRLKKSYGEFPLTVGQAQKWVNISIKYLFVLDRHYVAHCWDYCHIPLDRIVLDQLTKLGHAPPPIGRTWSRLDSYPRYLEFQRWFRHEFPGPPMDTEFEIWMRPDTPKAAADLDDGEE